MADIQIKPKNILEPSEKVLRMYEAVHSFMLEKRDISTIKVVDITSAAGIGKGTAYEYFSSKEEIIASAMAYEYKNKITELVDCMFAQSGFRNRVMNVMDWIYDNQEYNQLFSHIFRELIGEPRLLLLGNCIKQSDEGEETSFLAESIQSEAADKCTTTDNGAMADCREQAESECQIMGEGTKYIERIVIRLMQDAYEEGVITEQNIEKRNITVLSSMIQYGCILVLENQKHICFMTDDQLREFIYENMIKCLN